MKTDLLLRQTRRHFPRLDHSTVKIVPIQKGGSDRKFYRVRTAPDRTLILIKYGSERRENRHYVEIAQFLTSNGIRAPKIYFHDADEGLIWIEDLGERDLWSYRNEEWPTRRALYVSALTNVANLHSLPAAAADRISNDLPPEFDAELYRWEQQYFFENCLGRYFGLDAVVWTELAGLAALREISTRLAELPRVLVHRDFQSQNIMVRDGDAYLIDFQGMRRGLASYDLASLLFDPYVLLSATERTELLGCYRAIRESAGNLMPNENDEIVRLCAMQRLMQALGAYGFLGLVKGNKSFLEHVPAALASLREVLSEIDGMVKLQQTLASLPEPQFAGG